MRTKEICLVLFCFAAGIDLRAQWGVQTSIHHERLTGRHGLNWMAGLAFDPSSRTSIGLDVIGHLNVMADENFSEQSSYEGFNVSYAVTRKVIGMQYRSSYFLRDDNSGAYLGTYIGFRQFSREVLIQDIYSNTTGFWSGTAPSWARPSRTTTMLFPVGMRLGFRSEMDGWYGDLYLGLGYQIGHGKEATVAPYLAEKDKLKGFSFQIGYSAGIGWN